MGILSYQFEFIGEVGVTPRLCRMTTTDSLATITTPGFLNSSVIPGDVVEPTDVFFINYGANSTTLGIFVPTITNRIITLSLYDNGTNPTGFTWNTVTGTSQAAIANNGYIVTNSGLTTVTLPATSSVGDTIGIIGDGAGGWVLQANTMQTIRLGTVVSATAGSLSSGNRYDTVTVVCVSANSIWQVNGCVSQDFTIV